jgi:hypothetical protein
MSRAFEVGDVVLFVGNARLLVVKEIRGGDVVCKYAEPVSESDQLDQIIDVLGVRLARAAELAKLQVNQPG